MIRRIEVKKGDLKDEYSLVKQVKYHPTNCDAHYNLALFYFEKQRFKDALKHFTTIRDLDSSFKKLLVLEYMADCLFESKDLKYEPALEAYKTVLEESQNPSDPGLVHIHIKIGRVYEKMKLIDRAIKTFQYAIQISPKDVSALQRLGWAYVRNDEVDKAVYHLKKAC